MGIFKIRIEVGDLNAAHFEEFEASVGTPSVITAIPTSSLHRLGITPYKREVFILPDDSEAEYDVGHASVRVEGREAITQVVFVGEDFEPRLGRLTLSQLQLRPDLENERLVKVPGRLVSHPTHL
jgi:predicted aspartyl protease